MVNKLWERLVVENKKGLDENKNIKKNINLFKNCVLKRNKMKIEDVKNNNKGVMSPEIKIQKKVTM